MFTGILLFQVTKIEFLESHVPNHTAVFHYLVLLFLQVFWPTHKRHFPVHFCLFSYFRNVYLHIETLSTTYLYLLYVQAYFLASIYKIIMPNFKLNLLTTFPESMKVHPCICPPVLVAHSLTSGDLHNLAQYL